MRHSLVLAGQPIELVTSDWPFEDDEALCLELAETRLRRLEQFDPASLGESLSHVDAGPLQPDLERILDAALVAATADYETGSNGFGCVLELRPTGPAACPTYS